jgi:hypothetical protein
MFLIRPPGKAIFLRIGRDMAVNDRTKSGNNEALGFGRLQAAFGRNE